MPEATAQVAGRATGDFAILRMEVLHDDLEFGLD
jgi:hypothetical protein